MIRTVLFLLALVFGGLGAHAQIVPFTLPTAGSAGFEKGVGVCFKDIGSAGFSLQTSGGTLLGIPLNMGVGTIPPGGDACAISDPPDWVITLSGLLSSSGGGGSVTSVGATVPPEFLVSGVPITTTGTIAITKATELANTAWAGPTSGGASQPTFRALVAADIPTCSHVGNYGCINLENTWTLHQQPAVTALTDASTITVDGTAANLYTLTVAGSSHTLGCPGTIRTGTYNFRITNSGGVTGFATASCYKYPGGVAPTWSTTNGMVDVLSCSAFDNSRLECNALINLQ